MLKIEKTVLPSPEQWEIVIEGMRNPKNSWDKIDSGLCHIYSEENYNYLYSPNNHPESRCAGCKFEESGVCWVVGEADHTLMMNLAEGGSVHAKYRRMIPAWVTLTAPLYWWKEFDTYKVGTVCNSCSTMHKIHSKEFTLDDFSREHLIDSMEAVLYGTICELNKCRTKFLETKGKEWWWQMIQLLPTSYNQKRTVMLNYEVLNNIYHSRKDHKLDEWKTFCDWILTLPYSEIILGY